LRDCFGIFENWTKKMSIFDFSKKVLRKIFKSFTTRGVPLFDLIFPIFFTF